MSDAAAIARIHVETWRSAYTGLVPEAYLRGLSAAEGEKSWAVDLADVTVKVRVAEEEGSVVGWVSFGPGRDGDLSAAGEVYGIYVDRASWGRGHGRELMEAAERELASMRVETLCLWVFEENHRSRAFYAARGYVPDGGRKKVAFGGRQLVEVRYVKPARATAAERAPPR